MRALLLIATAGLTLSACRATTRAPIAPPPGDRAYVVHQVGVISILESSRRSLTILAGRLWQEPAEMPVVRDLAVTRDGATAFAPSSWQNRVFVVDLHAGGIETTIAVDAAPEEIELSRDGRRAYVTTAEPYIAVIDTQSRSLDHLIDIASPAGGLGGAGTMQVTRDGRRLCVLTQRADLVLIDTGTDRVARSVPLGGAPLGLALTPDSRGAWVAGFPPNAVALIDLASGRVLEAIGVGQQPLGLALTPDGRWLYVANSGSASISVIDTAAGQVATTIAVPARPAVLTATRDGAFILAVHPNESALTVIDTASRSVAYTMDSSIMPQWPTSVAVP